MSDQHKEEILGELELQQVLTETLIRSREEFIPKIQRIFSFENEESFVIDEIINNFELKPLIKEIKLNFKINSKTLVFTSCEEYTLKDLAVQLSFYLKENYIDANEFEVYFDHPKKDLLSQVKKNISNKDKVLLKDLDYSKFRFFLKYN